MCHEGKGKPVFVLDDLYVSTEVLEFLEESGEPVLENEAARAFAASRNLNIASANEAAALAVDPGFRIIALSEMHLDDVKKICGAETTRAIELCKDKAACRRALAPLFPDYVFEEYTLDSLLSLDPEAVRYPVVVKPSTGFFSLGIYPVFAPSEWVAAMEDIRANSDSWSDSFNASVVNGTNFLVESYIEGDEYAVDVYFDNQGEAVVLNILKHDFYGTEDVSDRLYYTSKDVIESQLEAFTDFFVSVNKLVDFKNFPVHVEVRVEESGRIVPIEFNPLRFAGLSTTDLSYFAYGFKTYEYFLRNKRPNWGELLAGKGGLAYPMILLGKPGFDANVPYVFDYEELRARFRKVTELRRTDFAHMGTFGFVFPETRLSDWESELDPILRSDLDEFITRG